MRGRALFRHSQLSKAQRQGWSEARRQRRQSGTGGPVTPPARAARGGGGFLALCFSCGPETPWKLPWGRWTDLSLFATDILLREISRGEGPVASVAQSGTPPCCSGSENERRQRSGSSSGARGRRALNRILRLVSPKMFPEGGLPLITERIQRWQGGQKSKVRIFFFFW